MAHWRQKRERLLLTVSGLVRPRLPALCIAGVAAKSMTPAANRLIGMDLTRGGKELVCPLTISIKHINKKL